LLTKRDRLAHLDSALHRWVLWICCLTLRV
jgi:hypothetical protein